MSVAQNPLSAFVDEPVPAIDAASERANSALIP